MKSTQDKLANDALASAYQKWDAELEVIRPAGITSFFVMDATARTGP